MKYINLFVSLCVSLFALTCTNLQPRSDGKECGEKLKDLIRLQSEADVEISAIADEGNFYKMIVRVLAGNAPLQEIYVSKDCSYMTDKLIKMDTFREQLKADKVFAECLVQKEVRVFGVPQDAASVQQIAALGNFAAKVFVNCSGQMMDKCKELGLKEFPTLVYRNQAYPGVWTREKVATLTECGMGTASGDNPSASPGQ